jgi:hypothetical protein
MPDLAKVFDWYTAQVDAAEQAAAHASARVYKAHALGEISRHTLHQNLDAIQHALDKRLNVLVSQLSK